MTKPQTKKVKTTKKLIAKSTSKQQEENPLLLEMRDLLFKQREQLITISIELESIRASLQEHNSHCSYDHDKDLALE